MDIRGFINYGRASLQAIIHLRTLAAQYLVITCYRVQLEK
jgi:hypothetical protein